MTATVFFRLMKEDDKGGASVGCLSRPTGRPTAIVPDHDPGKTPALVWGPAVATAASSDAGACAYVGVTWTRVDAGLHTNGGRGAAFITLAIDPADANRVFVSELQGVFRTTDGGRTWIEADGKLPVHGSLGQTVATNLAIDPHNPETVYASGSWGVYRTINGGQTWYPIVGGLPPFAFDSTIFPGDVGALLVDPVQSGKIYGGTLATGIYTYTVR